LEVKLLITAVSRRVVLSAMLAAGWSQALAKTTAKPLPNCVQGGITDGWNWSARLSGILFGRDAARPEEASVMLSLTTITNPSSAEKSDKENAFVIHYLPNAIMQGVTSVHAFWDGQSATTIELADATVIRDAADASMPFQQAVFEPVTNATSLPHPEATLLTYELQAADGSQRRFSVPLSGFSSAHRQAMKTRRKLVKKHKAGLCLGPDDCFLTTATCSLLGLADDCFELVAARRLRDDYLCHRPGGDRLIDDYYRHAPAMAHELWASARGKRTLLWIYWTAILPCALMVACGAYRLAARRYASMFASLRRHSDRGGGKQVQLFRMAQCRSET
jgi:hypothetical protein